MTVTSPEISTNKSQQPSAILENYGMVTHKQQDELIYTPEQAENATFYILDGYVRIVNRSLCKTRVIGPGEYFGDRSIFNSKNIYAEALSSVSYLRINESSFEQLMYHNTKLAMDIVTDLSNHYIYLNEKQSLMSVSKEIYSRLRKGHSIKYLFVNWKNRKGRRPICWN